MISFYIQANEVFVKGTSNKRLAVNEYFKFKSNQRVERGGKQIACHEPAGSVDAAIIKCHPKEYGEFKSYLDAHDELLEEARKQPGVPFMVEIPKEKKVEAPKSVVHKIFHSKKKAKE